MGWGGVGWGGGGWGGVCVWGGGQPGTVLSAREMPASRQAGEMATGGGGCRGTSNGSRAAACCVAVATRSGTSEASRAAATKAHAARTLDHGVGAGGDDDHAGGGALQGRV